MAQRYRMGWTTMNALQELYACAYAKEFPAQAMLRLRPEIREKAVVVLEGEAPLQTVCAMNRKARRMGIERGMTRVEMDTFDPVTVLVRSVEEEVTARAAMLECAGTFSPRVEDRSGRSEFLCVIDIGGTEKLFGAPQAVAQNLLRRMRALGVIVSVAVSSNFHTAIFHARGRSTQTPIIAQGSEGQALAALPLAVLDLSEEHTETFTSWGVRTLGELAKLPEKELVARLGQEGKRLRQLARGELPHLFVPMEAEFCLEERIELDAPVELLDSLLFVMSVMLEQLILRATGRVLALASVTVRLRLEGEGSHVRMVRPALPANDRKMWIKLLHLDLEAHPPSAAILSLVLTAEPGNTSKVQLGLFSPQLPELMKLDITLARIRAIVGEDCVGRPVLADTHRPDSFRVEPFTISSASASAQIPDRTHELDKSLAAVRQIRPGETIEVILRGPEPVSFSFRDRRYEVERAYGPWLTAGEWWNLTLWNQEQWDLLVRAGDGDVLYCCIVRDLTQHSWQLVALYD